MMLSCCRLCVLLACLSSAYAVYNLTILHTNDVHARFDQVSKYGGVCTQEDAAANKCYGGAARRSTKLKELRDEYANTLFLDGGDQFQGTFWFQVFEGEATAHFMKLLGYDAMAFGNHEFDDGLEVLQRFVTNVSSSFDVVNSNIDNTNEPRLTGYKKYVIKEVNGRKVGIVGFTTKDTVVLTKVGNTGNLVFNDEVESVQAAVNEMLAADPEVNIVIAIGHAGFLMDQRIAREVDQVDLVVGGHTNTFLYTGPPPSNEVPAGDYPFVVHKDSDPNKKAAVTVQAFYFSKYLGNLHLSFDDAGDLLTWGGNPILLDGSIAQDPDIEAELAVYRKKVDAEGMVPAGRTIVMLQGDTNYCRLQECNMGNLIADSLVYANLATGTDIKWARASLAIWNGGSVRSPVARGNITFADVKATMPFSNTIDAVVLKGTTMKKIFERSVKTYNTLEPDGGFLQVSGIHVTYDLCKPPGERVLELNLLCVECEIPVYSPVDDATEYTLLMPAFIASGGDGYDMIVNERLDHENLGLDDSAVFMEYLTAMGTVYPAEEGRIKIVNDHSMADGVSCPASSAVIQSISILAIIISTIVQMF